MKKTIATTNAPQAIGPYSQGIQAGSLVFASGQLPINLATGELVGEIKAAIKQALENTKAILEAGGSSFDLAVKVTIFLRDMNDFSVVNEIYSTYFGKDAPARSCVQVAQLPKNAILEIEAIGLIQ